MRVPALAREVGTALARGVGRVTSTVAGRRPTPVDILEGDDEWLVVFDAAGATASDVDLRFEEDAVHLEIERFRDHRPAFEMIYPGRPTSLRGQATLPEAAFVDPDEARAELREDGTLYVFLPKTGERADESVDADTDAEADADADPTREERDEPRPAT